MASPRSNVGSHEEDLGLDGRDLGDPIGDLDEWRPPGRGPWTTGLARLEAWVPARIVRPAAGAVAVLALLGVGWWLLRPPPLPVEAALPLAEKGSASGTAVGGAATVPTEVPGGGSEPPAVPPGGSADEVQSGGLVVQAAGAVGRPGVYRLAPGARVDDLVRAAGGLQPDADPDRVNLAAPVHDGERVWIPRVGEEPPDVVAGSGGGSVSPHGSGGDQPGDAPALVNINTAATTELEALPGVGPATAAAILAHRERIGSFGSVDELLDVRGIGEAKMEQLRPLITV